MSSAFSRSAFTDVIDFGDYSHFNWLVAECNLGKSTSYSDLLKNIYSKLSKQYRCEYVFKNELIKMLLKTHGTRNTILFSEFRVGKSIADIVMFNGISRAFEIKTEYDSPRRLKEQLANYKRLFDKCYLVIPEELYGSYNKVVDSSIGIILMKVRGTRLSLHEVRQASFNESFDVKLMMSCLRTNEYINITRALGNSFEGIPGYDFYDYSISKISQAAIDIVKHLFLAEVEKRKNNTHLLNKCPMPIRQMVLSLNLTPSKTERLISKLKSNIYK
jgi:hypothetical protein